MKKLVGILVTTLALGGTAVGAGAAIQNNNEAAQQAIEQAGVEQAYAVESELDYEKGKAVYDVEFESNDQEYEYEIDAETGAVLEKEKERDDDAGKKQQAATVKPETKKETATTTTDDIGSDKAKEIALQQAGVTEAEVTWIEVERDYDDGRLEYNVEFRVGNKEYEYEVDAKTGQVFERDVDVEDDFDDRYDDDRYDDDRYDGDWDDRYDNDWDDIWDD